jgi:SGNH hydrolase-like domain, acetyltransferase AlgX
MKLTFQRFSKSAFLLIMSVMFALLIAEILLRAFHLNYANAPTIPDAAMHHKHPADFEFRSFSTDGEFGGFQVRFDQTGYRVNPSTGKAAEKDLNNPATMRIALMGDSFGEALQVAWPDSFAGMLQNGLGPSALVRNFGVASYSPAIYSVQYPTDIKKWRPTDVFLLLFSNDPAGDRDARSQGQWAANGQAMQAWAGPNMPAWQHWLYRSYVARLARKAWLSASPKRASNLATGAASLEPLGDFSEQLVHSLAAKVSADGARFTLSCVPDKKTLLEHADPEQDIFCRSVQLFAKSAGLTYLDLWPIFSRNKHVDALYFQRDIHWTAAGHQIVAEELLAYYSQFQKRGTP